MANITSSSTRERGRETATTKLGWGEGEGAPEPRIRSRKSCRPPTYRTVGERGVIGEKSDFVFLAGGDSIAWWHSLDSAIDRQGIHIVYVDLDNLLRAPRLIFSSPLLSRVGDLQSSFSDLNTWLQVQTGAGVQVEGRSSSSLNLRL